MGGEVIYRNYPMRFDKSISERNAFHKAARKGMLTQTRIGGLIGYSLKPR
jgi:hypothetical protein